MFVLTYLTYICQVFFFNTADSEKAIEHFWAFNFELTNFHLFQQKVMPAVHDNDATVT